MGINVVGAGYVGLTSAAVLADLGHSVCCIDSNIEKIQLLNKGEVPIYEPGLKELIDKNSQISFMNESARICDKYDVNIEEVRRGVGLYPRINPHFLQSGIGYGGIVDSRNCIDPEIVEQHGLRYIGVARS